MAGVKIGIFDKVCIISTSRIQTIAGCNPKSYSGVWTVAAAVGDDKLLLTRGNEVICIPASGVTKVAEYDLARVTAMLGRLSGYETRQKDESGRREGDDK